MSSALLHRIESQDIAALHERLEEALTLVTQRNMALIALEKDLNYFQERYYQHVRAPLIELAQLRTQLTHAENQHFVSHIMASPSTHRATNTKKQTTTRTRQQTRGTHHQTDQMEWMHPPRTHDKGLKQLKQLYHHIGRLAHPDKLTAKAAQGHSLGGQAHHWMQRANEAYVTRDMGTLLSLSFEIEETLKLTPTQTANQMVQNHIGHAKRLAYDMGEWLAQLQESQMVQKMRHSQSLASQGVDLSMHMASQLNREIATMRRKLAKAHLQNMAHLRQHMAIR